MIYFYSSVYHNIIIKFYNNDDHGNEAYMYMYQIMVMTNDGNNFDSS